jgi:hypothetical protein
LSITVLFYKRGLLFSKFVKDHYRNAPFSFLRDRKTLPAQARSVLKHYNFEGNTPEKKM